MIVRLVIVSCLCSLVPAQTIREIIKNTPILSRLNQYMVKLRVYEVLNADDRKFTLFAPQNDAFLNIPASVQSDLLSNSLAAQARSNEKFMYHIIPLALSRQDLSQDMMRLSDATNSPPLFFRVKDGKVFVNGAELLSNEIVGSNGVVHIIDTFLHETGSVENALGYITDATNNAELPTIKKFTQLIYQYKNEEGALWRDLNGQKKVTLFVPTDDYMSKLSPQVLTLITSSKPIVKRVVDSHIITGNNAGDVTSVYHTSLLDDMALQAYNQGLAPELETGIQAGAGIIKPKHFGKDLYISNNCAQGLVVKGNITVGNGVIHLIDGILGYLPHDIYAYLDVNQKTLSRFFALVGMANMQSLLQVANIGVSDVPATDKYTVFVPEDSAFVFIDSSTSLTQDRKYLDKVLKMHILRGELSMLDVTNMTVKDTIAEYTPPIQAKFYRDGQDTIVEVDYVRGKVTRADTCVKNGIIHYVDHILGVPYFNIFQELDKNEKLIDMVNLVRQVGLDLELKAMNQKYTVFIPTNEAFQAMRLTDIGRKFLDSQQPARLESFLRRHIVKGDIFLDTIPLGSTREMQTEVPNIKIGVEHSSDNRYFVLYGTKRIPIIDRDMRKLNGVMNYLNGSIFSEDPRDLQLTSGSHSHTSFSFLILSTISSFLWQVSSH